MRFNNTTAIGESCRIIGDSNVFAFVTHLIGYNVNNLQQYILRYTVGYSLTSLITSHFVG